MVRFHALPLLRDRSSRVFYGGGTQSLQITLGGFAIAYLMRPLGAIFFGHIGDRLGRRHMLLISVALMTAAMLATALLPTRAQVGPAAGWLLLILRCVMGFSVGGNILASWPICWRVRAPDDAALLRRWHQRK